MSGYSSIVVGVDFTSCSSVALSHALRIAKWSDASLHVAHVIDTVVEAPENEPLSPLQERIRKGLVSDARSAWDRFAETVAEAKGLPIHVSVNNRVAGILGRARECHADLLVLGAYGDRPPDLGLGTLATASVRSGITDVLLVRETQITNAPFKTIVAAIDFSDASLVALERAAIFADADNASLHVLHVIDQRWRLLSYLSPATETALASEEERRGKLEDRLADFCSTVVSKYPLLRWKSAVYDHDHASHRSGIVAYASAHSAQLIVLGTRGRTNLRDVLLGSTAEKVLEESRCSVLAVKPEGAEV
ncbi:MAG: universal stress protein [Verrucomicrobia bacterium]|nr:universal stress protein [Verrucomicrobiota bacterium]